MVSGSNRPVGGEGIIARRRPTDFDKTPTGVPLYSGTCTCCCCLHWIGAVVGGGIGYARSSEALNKQRAPVRKAAHIGSFVGLFLALAMTVITIASDWDNFTAYWGITVALAPCVFFVPAACLILLSLLWSRRVDIPMTTTFTDREQRPGGKGGEKLQGAYRDAAASEHVVVDRQPYKRRTWAEFEILGRAVARIVGLSLLGTIAGYFVMLVIYLLSS